MNLGKLERRLERDIESDEDGRRHRLHQLIQTFCYSEISRLTGKTVRDEEQINELIRVYAKKRLAEMVIEGRVRFSKKELWELFKDEKMPSGDAKGETTVNQFFQLPPQLQRILIEKQSRKT